MPLKCHFCILRVHSATIIGNPDKGFPSIFDLDPNVIGSRINRIFKKLLHNGGGSLYHLSCSDFIRQARWHLNNDRTCFLLLAHWKSVEFWFVVPFATILPVK
jgi:hypothetical protein